MSICLGCTYFDTRLLIDSDGFLNPLLRVSDGWEPLCQFLETEVPAIPFPHENKAGQSGNIVEKYHKFDVFSRAEREVRGSVLAVCLSLTTALVLGGICLKKCLPL